MRFIRSKVVKSPKESDASFKPNWFFGAALFGIGLAGGSFDLATKVWRTISPGQQASASLKQSYLFLNESAFHVGISSEPKPDLDLHSIAENSTYLTHQKLSKLLDPMVNAYYTAKETGGTSPIQGNPSDDFVLSMWRSVDKQVEKNYGFPAMSVGADLVLNNGITLQVEELVCLNVRVGTESLVDEVVVEGVTLDTKGSLVAFDVKALTKISKLNWNGAILSIPGDSTLDETIFKKEEAEITPGVKQTFRSRTKQVTSGMIVSEDLWIPLLMTVKLSADGKHSKSFLIGSCFLPQKIWLKHQDGRMVPHEISDRADYLIVDPKFPGRRSGA